jgi:hypothetical protein
MAMIQASSANAADFFNSLLAHRAEKWFRFSAFNDAPAKRESIGFDPKSGTTFGSDALALIA